MHERSLFMRRCFDLARLGLGHNKTNPLVGSVLVANDLAVAEGYHQKYGQDHAEVNALQNLKKAGYSAAHVEKMYVSLEPCNHFGKTPPCSHAIAQTGIRNVIVSTKDPNANHTGGITHLQETGCHVEVGISKKEGRQMIGPFAINQLKHRTYIILKWAQSSDGFLAHFGKQTKISNQLSDRLVHKWRSEVDAILIGTNTALIDNPKLTTRLVPGHNPLRVVLDRHGKLPGDHHLLDGSTDTMLVVEDETRERPNVRTMACSFDLGLLPRLVTELYQLGHSSLMVEGGAKLLQTFLELGLWDECRVIQSSKALGSGVAAPVITGQKTQKIRLDRDLVCRYMPDHTGNA